MDQQIMLRILGCGSSGGVPRIGGNWGDCDPLHPKNRRLRSSALVRVGKRGALERDSTQILLDASPELRLQLLAAGVSRLDAVFISHDHADQCHGLDDLRALFLTHQSQVPVYMDASTTSSLSRRFDYCFIGRNGYPPILRLEPELQSLTGIVIDGPGGAIDILPLEQNHGAVQSLGFRFGPIAYCNDVKEFPKASMEALYGVEILIIDALRYKPHKSHAHLALALQWIEQLQPRRAILTNLHIDLDYERLRAQLPPNVEPAYDGMEIVWPS